MVGRGRDVRTHHDGGVEKARAVLDAGARKRLGVVARPHFVEILQGAVLHAAAARGAGLDQHVGVFGADAFHHLVEALRVVDPEARLLVGREVGRTHVVGVAVGVPLDVVDLVREFHRVVEDSEHEVLHLGVREVEQPLVAGRGRFALRRTDDPVGVLLGQLALGVDHLRFDPDAELQSLRVGVGGDVVDAFGEFRGVHLPVAQSGVGVVARVFVAEPAVVEDEHFQSHRGRVVDHLFQDLGVELEVGAFPAVEQRGDDLVAVVDAVVARPVVEVARGAARAAERVGVDHFGRGERLARAEPVLRGVGVGAGQDGQHVEFVDLEVEAEISAPGQRSGDDFAAGLAERIAVQREQERRVFGVGRAHLARRLDAFRSVGQQRVVDLRFTRPGPVEVRQEVFVGLQRERRGVEAVQRDGTLLAVADHGVRGDDVLAGVGREDQFHVERLAAVGHLHDGLRHVLVGELFRGVRHVAQFGVHVAVGMGDAQGGFAEVAASRRGIGQVLGSVVTAAVALVVGQRRRVVDASAEVAEINFASGGGGEHHRDLVGADVDDLLRRGGRYGVRGKGGNQGDQ